MCAHVRRAAGPATIRYIIVVKVHQAGDSAPGISQKPIRTAGLKQSQVCTIQQPRTKETWLVARIETGVQLVESRGIVAMRLGRSLATIPRDSTSWTPVSM